MRVRRVRLALVALAAAVLACTGAADPDPAARERFRTVAAPLVSAHDRLDAYAAAVAEGGAHARARALWPEVAQEVGEVVSSYDVAATGLDPQERSALVGYVGGLRSGLAAWERVDAAIRAEQAGADADVDARVDAARGHMRHLDGLRAATWGEGDGGG